MNRQILIAAVSVAFLFLHLSLPGQTGINYRFQYLQIEDGLPQNTINAIAKDNVGFMWFGTNNGICRYDGFSFESFKSEKNDPNSLPDNMISAIEPGSDNKLWIGSSNGLSYFDPSTDKIIRFSSANSESPKIIKVSTIVAQGDNIWVGTLTNGIYLLSKNKNGEFEQVSHFCDQESNLQSNAVNVIYTTRDKKIWAGTSNGLFNYSEQEKKFRLFTANNSILQTTFINDIFESKPGDIYIGTYNGLAVIRKNSLTANWYFPNFSTSNTLAHGTVNKVSEDIRGGILVGSLGGLQLFNPVSGLFTSFQEEGPDHFILNNKFVNTIYCDNSGNVWVGTEKGGVNKFNVFQKQFGLYTNAPMNPNSLNVNTVNSIYRENDRLWIGTAGGGLNSVDVQTGKFTHYKYDVYNNQSISSDFISSIVRGSDGNLWVGAWGGGVNCIKGSASSPSIQRITANTPGYKNDLVDYFVSTLWNDSEHGLLVIGAQGGLSTLSYSNHKFTTLTSPNSSTPPISEVGCILKDSKNYYWIGTRNGLFRFPASSIKETESSILPVEGLQFYTNNTDDSLSLPGHYIISLLEDSNGGIWAGTYGNGFCKIEVQNNGDLKCTNFSQKDGLSNNVTYSILEDKNHKLWISTDYGLSEFNPKDHKFRNFYKQDGLLNNQFYWSASFKDQKGNLYFGGTDGLNFFNPEEIAEYKHVVTPKITHLKIFNQEIKAGEKRHKKVILNKPVFNCDTITLPYQDNNLSFDLSAFDFNLPEKTSFAYMIEGIDKEWIVVPAQRRFITYSNLPAKTFNLLIKASNSDGIWNNNPTKVTIIIAPPFWKTIWFSIVLIIGVLVAVFFTIQYQIQRLIDQRRILEEKVVQRTRQIEDQKVILEKQAIELLESNHKLERRQTLIENQKEELENKNNEISEQRDKLIVLNNKVEEINHQQMTFFTNISHEFRTPLTLIISPVEQMISKMSPNNETFDLLKIVNRNAQRLLMLINQLLEIRKIETGNQVLNVEKTDARTFILEIFNSFADLAQKNEIDFRNQLSITGAESWIDHEKLENVLYNLLSNAFKFTPKQGQIILNALTKEENNTTYLDFFVKDTGSGIPKEHIERLFDRFFQVPENHLSKNQGSGIGLSLVKDLVEMMHGTISVTSEPGQGSTFSVSVPVSKKAFGKDEIDENGQVFESDIKNKVALLSENISNTEPIENNKDQTEAETVLVVEDNADMRSFICTNLAEYFRVIEAENGRQGYEMAKDEEPSLIISDIMMPEMNGLDLCKKIKNNLYTSHIPIVLLTAKGNVEDFVEGLEQGADDYISKPFNIEILIAKVTAIIANRKKLKNRYNSLEEVNPSELTISPLDSQFFSKINEVVDQNYTNADFDVDQFASLMYMSRSQLYKKIKAITDLSTNDFINVYRLKKSAEMLKQGHLQVSEIAYAVGFNDPKYFSRIFRKFFKVSPSEFVKRPSQNE